MYSTVYIERGIREHQRVEQILEKLSDIRIVECNSYSEVFNRKSQDFRLQKQNPSLILARKEFNHVLSTPQGYGVGGSDNYYFSTMLNCIYDCRYCFLQGMYRSAHHVVFINYEDYREAILDKLASHNQASEVWFFSGYDCDSLAMEPIIGLANYFTREFEFFQNAMLELRTKSTQIRSLLNRNPVSNVVTAFSFTPQDVSGRLENKVPKIEKRIEAMRRLQASGWQVGLRFDPLIKTSSFATTYRKLFDSIFEVISDALLHSVSVGAFRLPRDFYRNMTSLYPDSKFLALPFECSNGMVSYPGTMEAEMFELCIELLSEYTSSSKIYRATME